jgi:hypothetical protein
MKAVAVSLFLLAVLMVFAAVQDVLNSGINIGAMLPAALVIYMFLRVARECRALERQERERASDR